MTIWTDAGFFCIFLLFAGPTLIFCQFFLQCTVGVTMWSSASYVTVYGETKKYLIQDGVQQAGNRCSYTQTLLAYGTTHVHVSVSYFSFPSLMILVYVDHIYQTDFPPFASPSSSLYEPRILFPHLVSSVPPACL